MRMRGNRKETNDEMVTRMEAWRGKARCWICCDPVEIGKMLRATPGLVETADAVGLDAGLTGKALSWSHKDCLETAGRAAALKFVSMFGGVENN